MIVALDSLLSSPQQNLPENDNIMTQFKKQLTISWRSANNEPIPEKHQEALEESGFKRAGEMIDQGYLSGELKDNIRMTDDDPEDGVSYFGHWEVSLAPAFGVIQLSNVDGETIGLYQYDKNQHDELSAVRHIESTLVSCVDKENPQDEADDQLEKYGIIRIIAGEANTNVI